MSTDAGKFARIGGMAPGKNTEEEHCDDNQWSVCGMVRKDLSAPDRGSSGGGADHLMLGSRECLFCLFDGVGPADADRPGV